MTASVFRTMQKKANVISFHKTCGWSVSWFWIYGKVLEQLIFNIIFELLKENELSEFMFTSVRFHTCWHLFARTDFDHPGNVRKSHPEVFCKKVFLEISQNSQESTCARASFLIKLQAFSISHGGFLMFSGGTEKACNFIKKGTLAQVFSCKFCKISKNTLFYRTPPVAPSIRSIMYIRWFPWTVNDLLTTCFQQFAVCFMHLFTSINQKIYSTKYDYITKYDKYIKC